MLKQIGMMVVVAALVSACGADTRTANIAANNTVSWDEISSPRNISHVYGSNLIQMR